MILDQVTSPKLPSAVLFPELDKVSFQDIPSGWSREQQICILAQLLHGTQGAEWEMVALEASDFKSKTS